MSWLQQVGGIDVRSLRAFRVGLGVVLIADILTRAAALAAHYSDAGVLPRHMTGMPPAWRSVFFIDGSVAWAGGLFVLGLVIGCLLVLGRGQRLASALGFVLWASLLDRNRHVHQAGDEFVRHLLLWSALCPVGLPRSRRGDPVPVVVSGGTIAILGQVAMLYLIAGTSKTGPEWSDGTAIWRAIGMQHMSSAFGHWLTHFPQLLAPISNAVVPIETWGVLLLFVPWRFGRLRTLGVAVFVSLHLGFIVMMRLGVFPWIDLVALLLFLPPWFWERTWLQTNPIHDPSAPIGSGLRSIVALGLLAAAVAGATGYRGPLADELRSLKHTFELRQPWAVFAPSPGNRTKWLVAPAKAPAMAGGRKFDLLHPTHRRYWVRMPPQALLYESSRWRKYDESIRSGAPARRVVRRIHHACRQWERRHPGTKLEGDITLWEFRQIHRGGRKPSRITRRRIASARCD